MLCSPLQPMWDLTGEHAIICNYFQDLGASFFIGVPFHQLCFFACLCILSLFLNESWVVSKKWRKKKVRRVSLPTALRSKSTFSLHIS